MVSLQSKNSRSGFTLIELLIAMSIVTILLTIGVPSFRYVTTANRVSTEINGLLGDLQFARAEAIREGLPVTLCPGTIGTGCATGATPPWTGWIVFSDTGVLGTVDGPDAVLRVQPAFSSNDTLLADNSIKAISFSRYGFSMGLPGPITLTLHDSSANAQYTRCLSLTIIGALSTQIGGAQTAESTTC